MGAALALAPGRLGLFSVVILGKGYRFQPLYKIGKSIPPAVFQMRSVLKPGAISGKLHGYKNISWRLSSNV